MAAMRRMTGQARERLVIYLLSLGAGCLSGLVIVGYRASIALFERSREHLLPGIAASAPAVAAWLVVAAVAGLAVALLVRIAPQTAGSGIPQVKALLMRRIEADWKRELPAKFAGGALALGAGLSLGREGPSIQLGALTGQAVCGIFRRRDLARYLVTAGAAAGISAAFNAPLAGVLFCVEELHRNVSPVMLTGAFIASFCANAVMWGFYGTAPVFSLPLAGFMPLGTLLAAVLVIGTASGLLGAVFNRGLLGFQAAFRRACPSGPARLALSFAAAAAVCLVFPTVTGGGERIISGLGDAQASLASLGLLFAAKLAFTLFSYASGSPGGIFLPMLSLGALVGALSLPLLAALGLGDGYLNNCILIGMVGFFTAVVRAPITGAVLITEMAGSFAHFPAFMLVAVVASLVTALAGNRPVYDSLLERLAPAAPGPTRAGDSKPVPLHIPLLEGCPLASCAEVRAALPPPCILAGLERGEEDLFPEDALAVHPGDVLRVLAPAGRTRALKETLLAIGRASGSGPEPD